MSDIYVEKLLKPEVTLKKVKLKYEKPKYLITNVPIYSKKTNYSLTNFGLVFKPLSFTAVWEKKTKKTFTSFSSVFQAVLFVIKLFNSDFSEFVTVMYTVYPFGRILVE